MWDDPAARGVWVILALYAIWVVWQEWKDK